MNFRHINKKLMYISFLFSFFCTINVYAEVLLFKTGDKASYRISQTLASEYEIFDEIIYGQSEATIDLDIEILSLNKKTSHYPFEVGITIRKILISEVEQDGTCTTIISYDSDSANKENKILATHLDKLINYPLVFIIEKDFQIREKTGYLTQMDEDFDSPSLIGLFGTTPWTFELLLTQLFHLSGKNLLSTNLYPVSCYQFLNWEDEALEDGQAISLNQSSAYIVNAIDSKKIEASWKGNAEVASAKDYMNGEVSVIGNVTWDIANPLIQKRDLEVKIEEINDGWFPFRIKISAQQTWQPTSL